MLPYLCDHARWFQQHAQMAEHRIDLHRKGGIDAPPFRAEAVQLFDAMLRVSAVPTHVPFTGRAVRARHGIRLTHYADDQIAFREAAIWRSVVHAPGRFGAKGESTLS